MKYQLKEERQLNQKKFINEWFPTKLWLSLLVAVAMLWFHA